MTDRKGSISPNHGLRNQFAGPGGISQLMAIAFPMIISQGAETVMMFVDRLFLARVSPAHVAAAMSGGLNMFMMMTFFFGIIGYLAALVGQYLGSAQKNNCGLATAQGLILAVASWPIIIAVIPIGLWIMRISGHGAEQQVLEATYFQILAYGSVLPLIRVAFGGFFSGIGKTGIVMKASLFAMLVNIGANYFLIFGSPQLNIPAMGMAGAAYGTIMGSASGVVILVFAYFRHRYRVEFNTLSGLRLNWPVMKRLIKFGMPAGVEMFLQLAAFTMFVQIFHSYGPVEAAAMTITFSWDLMAFLPMIGTSIAVTSLVGRFMGAGNADLAQRATSSALKVAWSYSAMMTLLFVCIPGPLVSLFTNSDAGDFSQIAPLATTMLRLAAIYTLCDSTFLVFGGALRGAGDTRWAMWISVFLHWLMTGTCFVLIKHTTVDPVSVWLVFALMVGLLALTFYLRFRSGKWRSIRVVETPDPEVGRIEIPME